MNLTNAQIITLADALTHLDGHNTMQLVEGKAVPIFRSYKITAATRFKLARLLGQLHTHIADFNRAKDWLIKTHSGGQDSIGPVHPAFNAWAHDLEALKAATVELDVPTFPETDPLFTQNELPITVLHALAPLISSGTAPAP